MAAQKTRGDSLRWYLSGAASDGGSQSDPNASLGNYRSSTEVQMLSTTQPTNITGVVIDYAAGQNGAGSGTLTYTASGTLLQWTAPGGAIGPSVNIGSNGTYVIEDADPNKWIRVTVTSGSLPGTNQTDSVPLAAVYNKVFDNVSASEASAGDTEYRALMVKNENAAQVDGAKVYISKRGISNTATTGSYASSGAVTVNVSSTTGFPDSGFIYNSTSGEKMYYTSKGATSFTVPAGGRAQFGTPAAAGNSSDVIQYCPPFEIGLEAPGGGGNIQTIANEGTAPAAVSFSQPTDIGAALSIGNLASAAKYGVWFKRPVTAGSSSITTLARDIVASFGAA